MSDAPPLVRQWMLPPILSGRHFGTAFDEIAGETGVSEKTIHRDPELFQQARFPLKRVICEREGPADFDLVAHFSKSFGVYQGDGAGEVCVRVQFSPMVARHVSESKWHHSQQLIPERDGNIIAEFRLADTEEIRQWIMSFGCDAEVLEPEELRRQLREELAAASGYYELRPMEPKADRSADDRESTLDGSSSREIVCETVGGRKVRWKKGC